jgi:hypothetical protein
LTTNLDPLSLSHTHTHTNFFLDFPGLFGHDEECSDLVLAYWCTLAETLEETGVNFSSIPSTATAVTANTPASNNFNNNNTPLTASIIRDVSLVNDIGGEMNGGDDRNNGHVSLNRAVRGLFLAVLEKVVKKMAYPAFSDSEYGSWSKGNKQERG